MAKNSVINMLNTKYIIYTPQARPIVNRFANGNAWFVKNYQLVNNANDEIDALANMDSKNTAVIDKRFEGELASFKSTPDSTASIRLTEYQPNHLTYESQTQSEQLAIFSEIYYPKGWNAYVDGKLADYFRADYTLRAMVIPAGKHQIEFRFKPKAYYTGEKIALVGSILLILSFLAIVSLELKNYFKPKTEEE
jgi:uncharacterized membrane protein YfhO